MVAFLKEEILNVTTFINSDNFTNNLSLPPGLGYAFTFEGSVIPDDLPPDEWIMDSGATSHFTPNKHDYFNYKPCTGNPITIPNGDSLFIAGVGDVKLHVLVGGKSKVLILKDVKHVPGLRYRLFSEIAIHDDGFYIGRDSGRAVIVRSNPLTSIFEICATGTQRHGPGSLFTLDTTLPDPVIAPLEFANTIISNSPTPTWTLKDAHHILGHVSPNKIIEMSRSGRASFQLSDLQWETCPDCMTTSMTAPIQPKEASRIATTIGEFVNADVIGPLDSDLGEDARYVSCLIDRMSSYASVETMATKSSEIITKHLAAFQQELKAPIKTLRSDNGKEYVNSTLQKYLQDHHILHETTTPHSPAQNGKAERFNRALIEMAKKFLAKTNDPSLWPYAVDHAAYVYNRLSHSSNPDNCSPFEMVYGHVPDISKLKPFGAKCWVNPMKIGRKKLEDKAIEGIYIGHPKNSDGYMVLDVYGKVHTSRYVKFALTYSDYSDKATESYMFVAAHFEKDPTLHELLQDESKREYWITALQSEFDSHIKYDTFTLLEDLPDKAKVVGTKLVCTEKLGPNNEVLKYKVRLVIQGFLQKYGIHYDETSAPVTDLTEILTLFTLAAKEGWHIQQLDVRTAFLNSQLHHDIYIKFPENLPLPEFSGRYAKLNKAVYGLKQAGFEWHCHLRQILESFGWHSSILFPCVYKRTIDGEIYYLLTYVDDILIFGPNQSTIDKVKDELRSKLDIEDLGEVSYYLGMRIQRDLEEKTIALDQTAYIVRLLSTYQISGYETIPCRASIYELQDKSNEPYEQKLFQSKIGALLHLARFTRNDISFAVGYLARNSSCPSKKDHENVDHIFRYLNYTKDLQFIIKGQTTHDQWEITGISDADYAEDRESSNSTTGYGVFLGQSLISWGSKKQNCVSESTTESEYIAMSKCCKKVAVIKNLLDFLEISVKVTLLCDNMSTIASIKRSDVPPKLKHIRVKYHSVKSYVKSDFDLKYIPTNLNTIDAYTKFLCRPKFTPFRINLNFRYPGNHDEPEDKSKWEC